MWKGKVLQDDKHMKDYGISHNSSIIIDLRLQGGSSWISNPKGSVSYRDVVKSKSEPHTQVDQGKMVGSSQAIRKLHTSATQSSNTSGPYIVDHMAYAPAMTINIP